MTELVARAEARAALERWLAASGTLMDAAAESPGAERLRGRGRVVAVPAPPDPGPAGTRWVVRHYHRGGAIAAALDDRYLRLGTPRPVREYRLLRELEHRGVPVPRAVGAAVYPAGPFYRGDLVTERVPGAMDLAAVLFGASQLDELTGGDAPERMDSVRAMTAAGRLVRLLHERGVVHPDLNVKNILITTGAAGPRAVVLDLDRGSVRDQPLSGGARRRMLDRFHRSVRKWEARSGTSLPAGYLAAFDAGYAGAAPLEA